MPFSHGYILLFVYLFVLLLINGQNPGQFGDPLPINLEHA